MPGNRLVVMWNECDEHERRMFLKVLCRLFGDEVRNELNKVNRQSPDTKCEATGGTM